MNIQAWLSDLIKPLIKEAVDDGMKDVLSHFDQKFDSLESAVSGIGTVITDEENNIVKVSDSLTSSITAAIQNTLVTFPQQIIDGIMGKLPHFPGF